MHVVSCLTSALAKNFSQIPLSSFIGTEYIHDGMDACCYNLKATASFMLASNLRHTTKASRSFSYTPYSVNVCPEAYWNRYWVDAEYQLTL